MATPTATDKRIEIGLDSIERALDDLPEVAHDWLAMDDGERASWSLDWDHLMGTYFRLLIQREHAGTLTPRQHQRYCALLDRLKESAPLIEDLQLYPPPSTD
ncbi:MAG: hypothetical protein ACRDJE_19825 [Dehalococcoidia bacterium]